MDSRPRSRPRGARGALLLLVLAAALGAGPAAGAQAPPGDGGTAPTTTAAAPAIFGTLVDPRSGPVEGVHLTASADGAEVGEATSDAAGGWRIPVPGAGRYAVTLDVDTLPDGVALRDAGRSTLAAVRVLEGLDKRVNFSLGARTSGTATGGRAHDSWPDRFLNLTWSGLVVGLVIALASIGLSLVFGTTGLVNFAHGEMVTFGALVAWWASSGSSGPRWGLALAGVGAVVLAGAFGGLQDRVLWRPLERRRLDLVSGMIVSIGLSMLLRYLYEVVFDGSPRPYRQYAAQVPWTWGPLVFPPKQLVIAGLAVVVIVLYALALQRTRLGTAIRAVSDNRDLAESSGIDVGRVVLLVWVAGSALAGLGGVTYSTLNGVQWDMGYRLLLPVFAAVVLGGMGTTYGPLVGGLAIGLVSELSTLWFPADFKFAWALAALIVVLLLRPQGILGRAERVG